MSNYQYETLLVEQTGKVLTISPESAGEHSMRSTRMMHHEIEDALLPGRPRRRRQRGSADRLGTWLLLRRRQYVQDERGGAIALRDRPIGAISPSGRRIIQNILWVEQPVICALNGVAAGLGATLRPSSAT